MTPPRLAAAIAAALAIAAPAAAQQDFSKVEVKAEKLAPTVWMLTGAGGNLGLSAGEDAVFLVDDQYAPLTERITAAIAQVSPKPVRFVLNTHWHGDHVGGNEKLGRAGAVIVAHDNTRKRLSTEQFLEMWRATVKPLPKAGLPVVTFSRDTTFHLNGEEIRAFHVPRAHTDGDAIVHFAGSDVIHMGDVFWNRLYPLIDTGSGGTIDGMVAAVDRALALAGPGTRIIPGHGPLATRDDLAAYREMLATIGSRIKAMIREGKKLEEIVEANPTADFDAVWGKGFIPPRKFAEMVAMNLIRGGS
ncbi:MAG TPA: MBL fold metallo-hydrolase [Usitatibacteraceae bacterium]|nr:MBL fold metallo-hydrolase [Usitatibacteraceae bacterium]HQY47930.1 MBL fold metallo-hydrolase [Usitatibacteraceae bacterium]HRA23233.1 MBL fold metallo-hydrolase [Usitatibacteraceae bacterium]